MDALEVTDQKNINDITYHIEKVITDNSRRIIDNSTKHILVRGLTDANNRLKLVLSLIDIDPRFDWMLIQKEMDSLYREDNTLTGFDMKVDFKATKTAPKRALLNVFINKKI
jgi:hypothetical protein